nr:hypothetical protein [Tanacetum cinerariifolium]
ELSDSYLRRRDCWRSSALGAVDPGRRFLRRVGKGHPRLDPKAKDDDPWFPVQPNRAVRGAGLLRARSRLGQTVRRAGGSRPR